MMINYNEQGTDLPISTNLDHHKGLQVKFPLETIFVLYIFYHFKFLRANFSRNILVLGIRFLESTPSAIQKSKYSNLDNDEYDPVTIHHVFLRKRRESDL
jgi:hypothetical protein